jgi:hypothetical protein
MVKKKYCCIIYKKMQQYKMQKILLPYKDKKNHKKMDSIQKIIYVPLEEIQSKNYDANVSKYGEHSDTCLICGKRTANKKNTKSVHYLTTGEIVSTMEDHENSQGCFPVGAECAKKLVIKFAF